MEKSKDVLDYKTHENNHGTNPDWEKRGLHAIVIGGNKLSRGLTLEGLTISYYLRSSNMYDTLMQMGRWFGYRNGYLDYVGYTQQRDFHKFRFNCNRRKSCANNFSKCLKQVKLLGNSDSMSSNLWSINCNKPRKKSSWYKFKHQFRGNGHEITRFMPSQRHHNWSILRNLSQFWMIQLTLCNRHTIYIGKIYLEI